MNIHFEFDKNFKITLFSLQKWQKTDLEAKRTLKSNAPAWYYYVL